MVGADGYDFALGGGYFPTVARLMFIPECAITTPLTSRPCHLSISPSLSNSSVSSPTIMVSTCLSHTSALPTTSRRSESARSSTGYETYLQPARHAPTSIVLPPSFLLYSLHRSTHLVCCLSIEYPISPISSPSSTTLASLKDSSPSIPCPSHAVCLLSFSLTLQPH